MIDASTVPVGPAPRRWQFAVTAGILGWVLDAFDFFVLVFLIDVLAAHFHVGKGAIVASLTVTLAMRPVGGLLLGAIADRFGRRRPLIVCVLYFSIVTALTPFAPNYISFLILRGLYGIGMGGYWGIGASVVMESSPLRWRGLFSGILQSGYPLGYLLTAVAMRTVEPRFGWHWMFLGGLVLAAFIALFTYLSSESHAWNKNKLSSFADIARTVASYKKDFLYCTLLMTVMTALSHGTQDLYPDFLKSVHGFSQAVISNLAILYNVGAILGALIIGNFSDRFGRRASIMVALCISLLAIPAWAFGGTLLALAAGSFLMQFGVQGAFGVIPAHLNELSPASVRSLFPGVVYQLGVLLSAGSVSAEYLLRNHVGYRWALTSFESCVIVTLLLLYGFGPERRGRDFAG